MPKIKQNIYINFQKVDQQKQVNVLLFGYAGHGKSRLFNNLCNDKHQVGFSTGNLTKQVSSSVCAYQTNLHIYDTPGIVLQSRKSIQIIQQQLNEHRQPFWNLIIIVCKLESRYLIQTVPNIKKSIKTLKDNSKSILIMVSHLDTLNDPYKDQLIQKFFESLTSNSLTQKAIVFSNTDCDFKTLSQLIYYCAVQNERISINIDEKNIKYLLNAKNRQNYKNSLSYSADKISSSYRSSKSLAQDFIITFTSINDCYAQMKIIIETLFQSFHHCVIYCKMNEVQQTKLILQSQTKNNMRKIQKQHIAVYSSSAGNYSGGSMAKITIVDDKSFEKYQLPENTDLIFNYLLFDSPQKNGIQKLNSNFNDAYDFALNKKEKFINTFINQFGNKIQKTQQMKNEFNSFKEELHQFLKQKKYASVGEKTGKEWTDSELLQSIKRAFLSVEAKLKNSEQKAENQTSQLQKKKSQIKSLNNQCAKLKQQIKQLQQKLLSKFKLLSADEKRLMKQMLKYDGQVSQIPIPQLNFEPTNLKTQMNDQKQQSQRLETQSKNIYTADDESQQHQLPPKSSQQQFEQMLKKLEQQLIVFKNSTNIEKQHSEFKKNQVQARSKQICICQEQTQQLKKLYVEQSHLITESSNINANITKQNYQINSMCKNLYKEFAELEKYTKKVANFSSCKHTFGEFNSIFVKWRFATTSLIFSKLKEDLQSFIIQSIKETVNGIIAIESLFSTSQRFVFTQLTAKIENKPNLLMLLTLQNKYIIGAFSEQPFSKQKTQGKKGFLLSITNKQRYNLLQKGENKIVSFDDRALKFGNGDLSILEDQTFSCFFGEYSNYFNNKNKIKSKLIGSESSFGRYIRLQFHQLFLQNNSKQK